MKNKILWIAGIVIILIAIFASQGLLKGLFKNSEPAGLKIGFIAPLSGEVAFLGEKFKKGVEMAAGEAIARGDIEIIYEDGGLENKKAISAYQKLKMFDKADLFIGPFGPEQILSVGPNLQENDTLLAMSLCEERLQKYPQVFCSYPSIPDQVASAIPIIREKGIKRLGFITENSELGDIIESELKKHERSGGYELVVSEKIKRGDKDFRTLLAKIKTADVDGFMVSTLPDEGYLILKQLNELGFSEVKLALFDAVEEILKGMGAAAEGVYLPGHISPIFNKDFEEKYRAKYGGETPDLYGALGHSIVTVMLAGLEKNDYKMQNLREKFVDLNESGEKTAIKGFVFRPDHTVSIPVETLIFKDGKIQQL